MAKSPTKTDADRLLDAQEFIRQKNNQIDDLKKTVTRLQRDEDTAEKIRETIFKLAQRTPEPPAWVTSRGGKAGSRGAPVTIWSDIHYGEVVSANEVGGVNEYNSAIANKRMRALVNITVDLAHNHMGRAVANYPGIIICLGGDMIGGDIHEELMATNDRTPHQAVNDLTDILAGAIDTMATKFGKAFVPCVVGNHGRSTKRPTFKRRVFTNYDWSIYCNLERHFRKSPNVRFLIPPESDAHFSVFGHRFLLTHGDSLGVKGGDGIIGAIGPIVRGAIKVHNSEAQIGRDFDTLLMCHWHTYMSLPQQGVIVNGCVKGFDEYARLALRARYSPPTQSLFFCHPDHGITASWPVYLDERRSAANKDWVSWQG